MEVINYSFNLVGKKGKTIFGVSSNFIFKLFVAPPSSTMFSLVILWDFCILLVMDVIIIIIIL